MECTPEQVEEGRRQSGLRLPGKKDRLPLPAEDRHLVGIAVKGDVLARHVVGREVVDPLALQLGAGVRLQLPRFGGEARQDGARRHRPQPGQDVGIGSSSIEARPRSRLIFSGAGRLGRKSATAAVMITRSAAGTISWRAASISRAVLTSTRSTPGGVGRWTGPATSTTRAPRRAASAARENPILPLERLPRKRTGSTGSKVGPAVTTTVRPVRGPGRAASSTAAAISSGSAILPRPTSPEASGPSTGPTIRTPRRRRVSTFSRTAGWSHIVECMAGAATTGPVKA